ncbi:response regulator [Methylobacterium oxalidis]|uniref:response regulator n=1 Tax=Methylobacterium oxalidis TaxID=944322 RepID=UPI00331528AC
MTQPPSLLTVLVADQDAQRRQTIAEVVRAFDPGAIIAEVGSGIDLVEVVLRHKPTLAFVGLHLEGLSGPEAVALARKQGGVLPCLILVAPRVFPQWQEIAQSLGAYEVLKLPLDRLHIGNLLHANARRQQPTSVLVASASEASRSAVRRVLGRSGFALQVEETDSGRHAHKLLRMGDYGLAFLDVGLPDLDGLELACQVQKLALPTKLTLLTVSEPEPIARAARYSGVSFVLKMPFHASDIDLALHHAYGLRRPYLLNALTKPPAPSALIRVTDLRSRRPAA